VGAGGGGVWLLGGGPAGGLGERGGAEGVPRGGCVGGRGGGAGGGYVCRKKPKKTTKSTPQNKNHTNQNPKKL